MPMHSSSSNINRPCNLPVFDGVGLVCSSCCSFCFSSLTTILPHSSFSSSVNVEESVSLWLPIETSACGFDTSAAAAAAGDGGGDGGGGGRVGGGGTAEGTDGAGGTGDGGDAFIGNYTTCGNVKKGNDVS